MRRFQHLWPLMVAVFIMTAQIALHWRFTVDDAFISARYAQHLAAGFGARFNVSGAPVEGFTSPLAVALQALFAGLGGSPVLAGKVLGVIGAIGTVIVLRWFVARSDHSTGMLGPTQIAVLLLTCIPQFAVHAVSGLETTLFSALLLTAIALTSNALADESRGSYRTLACVSLLLGLARPEGNLAAAGLWLAVLWTARRGRLRAICSMCSLYLLPAVVYFALRWEYFGLPLPLPFYVKASQTFTFHGFSSVGRFVLWSTAYLGLPLLVGMIRGPRDVTRAVLIGTVPLIVFYCWPTHIMGFSFRFMFPLVPSLCAVAAFGVDPLASYICRRLSLRVAMDPANVRAVIVAFMLVGMLLTTFRTHRYYSEYAAGLERAHIRLGRDLRTAHPDSSNATVVTADCGAIPYYSGLTTVDSFGLNSPSVALHPDRDRASLLDPGPEYLVVLSSSPDRFVPRLSWEQSLYDAALARGYRVTRQYEFRNDYFLLLLVSPRLAGGIATF